MTPKSEFGSRVKFFFWKFSLEMIDFILIRNPNEILRVKLSKPGFHFQNFIPYKKQPYLQEKSSIFLLFTPKIDVNFFLELLERSPKTLRPSFFGPHPLANGEGGSPSSPPLTPAPHSLYWMTQQTGYSEDPYSRPSPRLPLHHFSQRRMLASLLRREARRSQGDLEALARGQRFFSLHQFTLCCCMLFTTLRCQPPPHSHLERPIINPIFLEYNILVPERHGRRPSPWAAKKREKKNFLEVS